MKKVLSLLTAISLSTATPVLVSAQSQHHGTKVKIDKSKRQHLNKADKKTVMAVFKANEDLHAAFFKFDPKKVESEAKKLSQAIDAVRHAKIKKMLGFSQKKLQDMKASASRDSLNKNYNLVSMALIHILKNYHVGPQYNAYSCPMVKKKWVQNSGKMEKIHNPYAAKMPHCGVQNTKF